MPTTKSRRIRLLSVSGVLGLTTVLLAPVAANASECNTSPYWELTSSETSHTAIGPVQHNTNGGELVQSAQFSSETSGTVSVTASASITGGLQAGLASVQAQVSASATSSVSVTTGNSTTVSVPAHSTVYGSYGADTVIAHGRNVQYSGNCTVVSSETADITAPTSVGWNTWVG